MWNCIGAGFKQPLSSPPFSFFSLPISAPSPAFLPLHIAASLEQSHQSGLESVAALAGEAGVFSPLPLSRGNSRVLGVDAPKAPGNIRRASTHCAEEQREIRGEEEGEEEGERAERDSVMQRSRA